MLDVEISDISTEQ